jgi:hypothetical protein
VGAALLDEAEKQARAHPARALRCKVVDVRPELPPYYAARGLVPVGVPIPFVPAERLKPGAVVHFIELVKHYEAHAS